MNFFMRVSAQIKDFLTGLSVGRKAAVAVTAVTIVIFVIGMLYWASQQSYEPITHGPMSPDDSANVMRLLREKKIPFQVDVSGRQVKVPSEYLNDLRLELAMQGMPQSAGTGYELFDKQSFGTTSFVNKLNQKRALEGELMRSINTIKGVKRSRVHLALPEKSAFIQDQKKVTASVVLDLENGVQLNEKQIYGVGHLVSSAVEGLDPANVAILDSFGKELSKNIHDSLISLTSEQSDYKRKLEENYQSKVEDVLSKVVGEGRVKASITADLDFSNIQESQTILDQDGATIKSQQKIGESMEGSRPVASGPAGATSNTPGDQPGLVTPNAVRNNTNKSNEIVNYEIPKTIRTTSRPVGSLKKISVAVLIDGKQVKTTNADGTSEIKSEQWSADKIKEFEALVAGALAIDKTRGDTLEIKNMEFVRVDFEEAEKLLNASVVRSYIQQAVLYAVIALVIVLFFFFVVRPYIRWITDNTTENVDTFLPQTIEELEKIQKSSVMQQLDEVIPDIPERLDPDKIEGEMIREKISTLIENNPHKASLILKDWLTQGKPGESGKLVAGDKGKAATTA
jgi:flagellar M-ring protein FliF